MASRTRPRTTAAKAVRGPSKAIRERAGQVHERLLRTLPEPQCELDHRSPWELLVATILSAQSTDRMVNRVTPRLFERYPTPAALGEADPEELEAIVKPTGFFRTKAKAIRETSRILVEEHCGEVPQDVEALTRLPGVARKTANVVLGTAFGIAEGIAVDTHAGRVSRRLGFTKEEDPVKVERVLCALFPREDWTADGHRLVLHGRYVCLARSPKCGQCPLNEICPSSAAPPERSWEERADRERDLVESRGQPEA